MTIIFRSLVYFLSLIIVTTSYSTVIILGWFLQPSTINAIGNHWGKINLILLRWICGLHYEISGTENLTGVNALILSKHQSAWETIAFRCILPADQVWVLKRELLWIPFFGWALSRFNPIAINRSSGQRAVRQIIEQGKKALADGRWVVIFPEGTRVAPGQRRRYGIGGAMLAVDSGYSVVPVAHNAGVFWRRRSIRKYPGTIKVVIGPPIYPLDNSPAEVNRQIEDWIETTVSTLPQSPDKTKC